LRYGASARPVKTSRSFYNPVEWVRLEYLSSAQDFLDKALVALFLQQTRLPVSLYLIALSSLMKRKAD
jgi:hypothetical protein